jgi:hypothetical protein
MLTIPMIAARLGVRDFEVRQLVDRGVVTPTETCGVMRLFDKRAVGRIREALVKAGKIKPRESTRV